jgi:hypothetical protein
MQSPMTRTPGSWLRSCLVAPASALRARSRLRSSARLAAIATLALLATGCSNGQLVDAGGERGAGGLAFVVMAGFFWIFFGALFYMDRQRKKRNAPEE